MTHSDTLAKIQFEIAQTLAFCPMPPHTYNEIAEQLQKLAIHINENFQPKDAKPNTVNPNVVNKVLFAEVTKEFEKALNKITEYEQINLKLNTIIAAKNKELEEANSAIVAAKQEIFKLKETKSPQNTIEERVSTLEEIVFSSLKEKTPKIQGSPSLAELIGRQKENDEEYNILHEIRRRNV
jgi:chromatin remodeling complex protein RSC6